MHMHTTMMNPPSPSPPKLRVAGLTKRFGGAQGALTVMDGVSFDVQPLEFLALLGPSGCGKSTLLRAIGGLEQSDSGSISIDGKEIHGPGIGRAMVFQSFDLFPWRTAIENIEFGLEVLKLPRAQRHTVARRYIELVGLGRFENSYPHQLSGGMQQRVGIARALAVQPDILLMDEPFGALDIQTRDLLQDELLRIGQKEKKTVLFVTHSIEEALYLADRVLVFSPRPASIQMDLRVPFGRPRSEEVKADPEFIRIRQEIWHTLKHGVQA
jgi:NitT/TauT family transport system ATP-binding protein